MKNNLRIFLLSAAAVLGGCRPLAEAAFPAWAQRVRDQPPARRAAAISGTLWRGAILDGNHRTAGESPPIPSRAVLVPNAFCLNETIGRETMGGLFRARHDGTDRMG